MKQFMVFCVVLLSIVSAAEHKNGEPQTNAHLEQIQHKQAQAGPVGAALAEIKNALSQPKTLALLASIGALQLASSYGDWSPEAVLLIGALKYMAGASVCGVHMPSAFAICSFVTLAGIFWSQYRETHNVVLRWIAERSGGEDFGIAGNIGVALGERTLIYWGWKKP